SQAGCDTLVEKIEVKKQERIDITVNFAVYSPPNAVAEKPVIYLYPAEKTEVSVSVKPAGEFLLTYPEYNNGWNVTAYPDGTIESAGKKYNYLFWEASVTSVLPDDKNIGSVVEKDNLMSFLESSLTAMGLTSKEQQDFITYWYPQMAANDKNLVRFLVNDECNTVSTMQIMPEPDHVLRVYMVWMNAEGKDESSLQPQTFPTFTRSGFTVVEWGGMKMDILGD
ncbi:MAG: hypothetical protein ACHQF2_07670, partial [Flavobacteriales bacterium]